jgi:hypothetical protein
MKNNVETVMRIGSLRSPSCFVILLVTSFVCQCELWAGEPALKVVSGGEKLEWRTPSPDDPALRLVSERIRPKIVVATVPGTGDLPSFKGGSAQGFAKPRFFQLYDNGRRLPIARWPKKGHANIAEGTEKYDEEHPERRPKTSKFGPGVDDARLERWSREPELWTWAAWDLGWSDAVTPVLSVDTVAKKLEVSSEGISRGIARGSAQGGWFQIRNAFSELSEPGEWAVLRSSRRVYLVRPDDGIDGVSAATQENIYRLTSKKDVIIENQIIECCRGEAVLLRNCTNVVVRHCIIRNTGGSGVVIDGGKDCRVEGCDIYDVGECGVSMKGGVKETLEKSGHVVDNCHIHHYGRVIHNYRPGISMGGVGNSATHNLIHDSRHAGIIFTGNDQYIAWNIIHDVCQDNYDCGAIYTHTKHAWSLRGSVLEHNLVHMVGKKRHSSCTSAFYLDGWSSGITVRHNIASRATDGFFQNGGNDNRFEGNLALACVRPIVRENLGLMGGKKAYPEEVPGVFKGRNSTLFKELEANKALYESELWRRRYPNMLKVYEISDPVKAHNSFYSVIVSNAWAWSGAPGYADRDQMEGLERIEGNFAVSDPGFVDYDRFDWAFTTSSEARKIVGDLGFEKMGLYESELRVSRPVKFGESISSVWRRHDQHAAKAIVRVTLSGKLPEGVKDYLVDPENLSDLSMYCPLGTYHSATCDLEPEDGWRQFSFAFTPTFDCEMRLIVQGWRGDKTLYDDFSAEGCTIPDPGFEVDDGTWRTPVASSRFRAEGCNVDPPYGIVGEEVGVKPFSGKKMMLTNMYVSSPLSSCLKVKKGVRVKVSFWARSFGR